VELHRAIEESADAALAAFENSAMQPVYPPGVQLSRADTLALNGLQLSDASRAAIRKLFVDAAGRPLFHLFSLIDGVADPAQWPTSDPWLGLTVSEKDEDAEDSEMWHDQFFESYWDYRDATRA